MIIDRLLRKIIRNYHDIGPVRTFSKSLLYLISPVYERRVYRVYRISLGPECLERECGASDFDFRLIASDATNIIDQIEAMEEWLAGNVRDRLAGDHICIAAMDGNRVAGFNLIGLAFADIPLLRKKWALADGEAWSEQITVGR